MSFTHHSPSRHVHGEVRVGEVAPGLVAGPHRKHVSARRLGVAASFSFTVLVCFAPTPKVSVSSGELATPLKHDRRAEGRRGPIPTASLPP
ncbi:MAG: hypothetical protein U0792_13870 [Gemmataceae bacterium]